jgi:Kef-type K+ transport system membrane component KefB
MDLQRFVINLPFQNPVLIFATVLIIVLFSPVLFKRLRIPHFFGLILSGILLGPKGLHVLAYDESFSLFGSVGLLYILFLTSLEINLDDLNKTRRKGLIFGLLTFLFPFILGVITGIFVLSFRPASALLLGTMFASHTLLYYPITLRFGINKITTAQIAIFGTVVTVVLSLLLVGSISAIQKISFEEWMGLRLGISLLILFPIVLFVFPYLTHRFFLKYNDNVLQFIFVLGLVFLGAFFSEVAGLASILGAFVVGLVLNKYIPRISPLMNRIKFVGNALFIPFFLISIGMLIDVRLFFTSFSPWLVGLLMLVVATGGKWLSAWITQKILKLETSERQLLFGLSNARAVVTLAIVFIGYNLPLSNGERLLSENVLMGTVIMIFGTGLISSLTVQRASRLLAEREAITGKKLEDIPEKILIPIANRQNIDFLVELAVLIKEQGNKEPVVALSVIDEEDKPEKLKECKQLLLRAQKIVAATDHRIKTIIRHDINVVNGIINATKENQITDVIMGLHKRNIFTEMFFGSKTDALLSGFSRTIIIFKSVQPINTIRRIRVTVPPKAELEIGFERWLGHILMLAKQIGATIVFYAQEKTNEHIKERMQTNGEKFACSYRNYTRCEEMSNFSDALVPNDLLVMITARKSSISSHSYYERLPYELSNTIPTNSIMVIYPEQRVEAEAI